MPTPSGLLVEIASCLHAFGVRATRVQVCFVAGIYQHQRPRKSMREVAEAISSVPWLPWPHGVDTIEARVNLMAALTEQLDAQYWVATLEHDSARGVSAQDESWL
jgi:hypothetical protein